MVGWRRVRGGGGGGNCQPPVKNRDDQRNVNSNAFAHTNIGHKGEYRRLRGRGSAQNAANQSFCEWKGEKKKDGGKK